MWKHVKASENHWKNHAKKNHCQKAIGNPLEKHWKSCENHVKTGKTCGKLLEHWKILGKCDSSHRIPFRIFRFITEVRSSSLHPPKWWRISWKKLDDVFVGGFCYMIPWWWIVDTIFPLFEFSKKDVLWNEWNEALGWCYGLDAGWWRSFLWVGWHGYCEYSSVVSCEAKNDHPNIIQLGFKWPN